MRLTGVGAAVLVLFLAGAVLFFVASRTVALVGGLVALLAVAFVAADQLPAGLGGGWMAGKGRRLRRDQVAPEPQYIERAETPSDDAWQAEQQRYREKHASSEQ